MLVAKRENGIRLSLAQQWDKKVLTAMRAREKFYCQQCNEEVIMKLGSKRIWHFSHQAGSICEYEYDRESTYHLSGKIQLYNWLIEQGINAELEKYDPVARQTPDVVFDYEGKKYALEFQCSVIPEELFIKRTETYKANGYIPIWIAAESLIRRSGPHTVSLSNFLYLFMNRTVQHWFLTAFCPISSQFINLHHIVPIASRKALTQIEVHSIQRATVKDLLCPRNDHRAHFLKQWQKDLLNYQSRYVQYPGSMQNDFLQELYRNRMHILHLPPHIGIPVPSSQFIETPPLIWQTYLFLDIFKQLRKGQVFNMKDIQKAVEKRIYRGKIQLRKLPLAGRGTFKDAVDEYISLLTTFAIIVQISPSEYKLNKEMKFFAALDEQQAAAALFYNEYGNIIESFFRNKHEKGSACVK